MSSISKWSSCKNSLVYAFRAENSLKLSIEPRCDKLQKRKHSHDGKNDTATKKKIRL